MTTRPLSAIVNEARARAKEVTTLTTALVKAQLKRDGSAIAAGTGCMVAAIAACAAVPPLLVAALVLGLVAMGLWPWLACLIVVVATLGLAFGLVLAGKVMLKRVGQSTHQTMEQVKGSFSALSGTAEAKTEDSQ